MKRYPNPSIYFYMTSTITVLFHCQHFHDFSSKCPRLFCITSIVKDEKLKAGKKSRKDTGIDLDRVLDEDENGDEDMCINSACLRTSSLPYDDITVR